MSITFAERLPENLISRLFESDRESHGQPRLQPGAAEQARAWLRRMLVEFDALDQHIALLQKLYDSPFQYPRPRRDRCGFQQTEGSNDWAFTHTDRLDDEKVTAILDAGVDALTDDELASLLLNPVAVFDLHDCIDDVQPDYWIDAIHDFVSVHRRPRQSTAHLAASNGHAYSPLPPNNPASQPNADFWPNLTAALAAAVRDAHRPSAEPASTINKTTPAPLLPSADPSHTFRLPVLQYSLALAASIALAFFSWSVLQMTSAIKGMPQQIAELQPKNAGESPRIRNRIALTAGPGDMLTLEDLDQRGFLEPEHYRQENPKQYLEEVKASAEPALRALIEAKQEQLKDDLEVLEFLHSLLPTESTDK